MYTNRRGYENCKTGLTDCAVFPIVACTSAVTLILVLIVPYTHTAVLTGQVTAGVH